LLQVNYLSHFLIAAHLLPTMKQSGPDCRILLVSSVMHTIVKFNIQTLEAHGIDGKRYDRLDYYGRSKLYQVIQFLLLLLYLSYVRLHLIRSIEII